MGWKLNMYAESRHMELRLVGNYLCPLCKRIAYYMTRDESPGIPAHLISGIYEKQDEGRVEVDGICPCYQCGEQHRVLIRPPANSAA